MKALILALVILLAFPTNAAAATIGEKCVALTAELNRFREPDVRLRSLLCTIGHARSLAQAHAGRGFHDIAYVARKLNEAGVCYRLIGEAIAWTGWPPTAAHFIGLWRASAPHWSLLSASRYDRSGGSWRAALVGSGTYATFLVLDSC